jgi:hypothetical protein
MNAPRDILAPSAALRRLADFLHESGNRMQPAEAAAQGKFTNLAPTPTRGYQWKSLFLPDGTELRMSHGSRRCNLVPGPARVAAPDDHRDRGRWPQCVAAETMKTALALVDHAGALALPQYERRTDHARRTSDRLAGDCAFD